MLRYHRGLRGPRSLTVGSIYIGFQTMRSGRVVRNYTAMAGRVIEVVCAWDFFRAVNKRRLRSFLFRYGTERPTNFFLVCAREVVELRYIRGLLPSGEMISLLGNPTRRKCRITAREWILTLNEPGGQLKDVSRMSLTPQRAEAAYQ